MIKELNYALGIVLIAVVFIISNLLFVPDISAVEDVILTKGAHRGSSVYNIENSMLAFQEALNNPQYKFIEFDIQYTQDKKIIVYHDLSLLRLQGKAVEVSDLSYEELEAINDYLIPTYNEAMDLIGSKKVVNVEIKSQGNLSEDQELVDFIVADSTERGIVNTILISSISSEVVDYINLTYPKIKTGKIYWITPVTFLPLDYLVKEIYNSTKDIGADYLMLHGVNLKNYTLWAKLKPENVNLAFWYFDDQMYLLGESN
ncbi:MAG TPA: glycerophosphodiester phosphodiesterase family protein [Candidatus Nanoarchaeia archaeon]|nr:glycerophosphodiester phosphodiesterase family protein [Candidatus Nanoarchaeia archaeon]